MSAEQSFASRALDQLPGLREQVANQPAFHQWLDSHRSLEIDGTRFYVVGGDMLQDVEQMTLTWARQHGLVDASTIERLQSSGPSERSP